MVSLHGFALLSGWYAFNAVFDMLWVLSLSGCSPFVLLTSEDFISTYFPVSLEVMGSPIGAVAFSGYLFIEQC